MGARDRPMVHVTPNPPSRALSRAWARLGDAWSSILLASVAAATAWFIANRLLGHQQPFFAPIAAAVTLSTSRVQRTQRIVQLVCGVLLGIGIGEALSSLVGTSTATVGLIVLVTLGVAVVSGVGLFGEGMMFANQAAASAILVVTLHEHGTGPERAVDALIGGGVALVLGVLLLPADPLAIVWRAERGVLEGLADTLQQALGFTAAGDEPQAGWMTARTLHAHRQLEVLSRSRSTARTIVRVAPRRWHLRPVVAREVERLTQMEDLINAVLAFARLAVTGPEQSEALPTPVHDATAVLAAVIRRLADARQPWPRDLVLDVRKMVDQTIEAFPLEHAAHVGSVKTLLHTAAADLAAML